MPNRDLVNNLGPAPSVAPAVHTNGTVNGAEVDLRGFDSAMIAIIAGTITDGTHTFEVQESDTSGSGFAAVAAADLDGTEPALTSADSDTISKVGYRGSKRYIRVVNVTTSATTGGLLAAIVERGHPSQAPVA